MQFAVGESRVTYVPNLWQRIALRSALAEMHYSRATVNRGSNGRLIRLQHLRFRRASADPRRAGSQLGADEPTQGIT